VTAAAWAPPEDRRAVGCCAPRRLRPPHLCRRPVVAIVTPFVTGMAKLLCAAVVVTALVSTGATAVLVSDTAEYGGLFLEGDTAPVVLEHTLGRAAVLADTGGIEPAAAVAALALTKAQRASYPHLLRLDCGGVADYAYDGSVRDKEFVRELSASRTYVRPGDQKSTAFNAVRYAPTGDLNYDFTLPEGGVYNLTMYFEEVSPPLRAVGQRIFSVATEPAGKPVPGDVDDWSKVDVYAAVGGENVLSLTTLVTVSEAEPKLSLLLGRVVENPEISFISLYKVGGVSTPTIAPRAAPPAGELRLDCGGAGNARAGIVSDAPYLRDASATKTYTHPVVPISPTATVRYVTSGSLTYDFMLPSAGAYNLSFYAAELAFSTVGRRVFSVSTIPAADTQGGDLTDWSAVDIFKTVGARRALFLTSLVTVGEDKKLSLVLDRIANNPVAGFLVLRSTDVDPSSGEPRYHLKLDCGGAGDAGRGIVRDVSYVRRLSSTHTFPAPASHYNPLATLRYAVHGELAYDLGVQRAGAYRVTLYFAELFFSDAGKRIFSAATIPAGQPTTTRSRTVDWDKIDVYALVGKDRLLTISTTVKLAEGDSLSVVLGRGVNLPMLSRLDVRPLDRQGGVVTATPAPTATATTSSPRSAAPRSIPAASPKSSPTGAPAQSTPPPTPAPTPEPVQSTPPPAPAPTPEPVQSTPPPTPTPTTEPVETTSPPTPTPTPEPVQVTPTPEPVQNAPESTPSPVPEPVRPTPEPTPEPTPVPELTERPTQTPEPVSEPTTAATPVPPMQSGGPPGDRRPTPAPAPAPSVAPQPDVTETPAPVPAPVVTGMPALCSATAAMAPCGGADPRPVGAGAPVALSIDCGGTSDTGYSWPSVVVTPAGVQSANPAHVTRRSGAQLLPSHGSPSSTAGGRLADTAAPYPSDGGDPLFSLRQSATMDLPLIYTIPVPRAAFFEVQLLFREVYGGAVGRKINVTVGSDVQPLVPLAIGLDVFGVIGTEGIMLSSSRLYAARWVTVVVAALADSTGPAFVNQINVQSASDGGVAPAAAQRAAPLWHLVAPTATAVSSLQNATAAAATWQRVDPTPDAAEEATVTGSTVVSVISAGVNDSAFLLPTGSPSDTYARDATGGRETAAAGGGKSADAPWGSCRLGADMEYVLPIPFPGRHSVIVGLEELVHSSAGMRIFTVSLVIDGGREMVLAKDVDLVGDLGGQRSKLELDAVVTATRTVTVRLVASRDTATVSWMSITSHSE